MVIMKKQNSSKTRKERSRATHRAVLKSARKTLKKRGFTATTIREVAKTAGVAIGTVMAHFGSKEDLLYEVLHDDINQIAIDVLNAVDPEQPIDRILQFVGGSFLAAYASEPELYADFLEHSLFARGAWGEQFKDQVEQVGMKVGSWFLIAVEQGILRPDTDIRAATMTFFANYYFVLIGQIKSRFSDVESGTAQLHMLIHHQVSGLRI